MQRVKNIDYDEDDVYSDEEEHTYAEEADAGYSQEDKDNFTTLTPVVRAELDEAGVPATTQQIEEALWHYFWDVGKSVAYLMNARTPRDTKKDEEKDKDKPKSKFDEAAQKSAQLAERKPSTSAADWFRGTPWTGVPASMLSTFTPVQRLPQVKLLGGSSKLAKLAAERRKKAAAARNAQAPSAPADSLSSLERLSVSRDAKENESPAQPPEPKKYPMRRKRSPTPPPRDPAPPPLEPEEDVPNLRSSPTAFAQALSTGTGSVNGRSKIKATQPANGLAKKTEALKLDAGAATPPAPKVKSKGLDVPKLWVEEMSKQKASASFVVIGHVDHGKSTLMGRLLLDTGAVSQRDIDRYKKQATDIGKSSFALAWVMDTGSEERERGVTVDIAQHHFSTDVADFTILDAPGHRDFVPNMIGGASMADLGVLVVDANQLESGMKGQTREHILLASAVGLRKMVVAVNKLDSTTPKWDQSIFENVSAQVLKLLRETGFKEADINIVPCSGLNGDNVAKALTGNTFAQWISKHTTLLQQLEKLATHTVEPDLVQKPLRMQIADVFRGGITNPLSIAGRICSGHVQVGDVILVQPSGESAVVKGIEVNGEGRDWAVADDIPTLHLIDIEPQHLRSGDVACSPQKPIRVIKNLTVKVQALDSLLPQQVNVHIGRLHVPGAISHLVATEDAKGETMKKKPRIVKAGQRAIIKLVLDDGAPLETGDRVVLRAEGSTIAAGVIDTISI
ncbi:HBS1-like protein [Fulvia fulva]|uniref:HBS1-like protein n=1 Tax=Passalora fulva TaxID=5499 RepID=A0A9Q8L8N7_PASFU|nr:HBS1-like protein [Fulvia fulva]KAK4637469.1 HBS1-like protein [Fulvia fulva]UJO12892.1 HBS1-like protein [Fulvia fulva]